MNKKYSPKQPKTNKPKNNKRNNIRKKNQYLRNLNTYLNKINQMGYNDIELINYIENEINELKICNENDEYYIRKIEILELKCSYLNVFI